MNLADKFCTNLLHMGSLILENLDIFWKSTDKRKNLFPKHLGKHALPLKGSEKLEKTWPLAADAINFSYMNNLKLMHTSPNDFVCRHVVRHVIEVYLKNWNLISSFLLTPPFLAEKKLLVFTLIDWWKKHFQSWESTLPHLHLNPLHACVIKYEL